MLRHLRSTFGPLQISQLSAGASHLLREGLGQELTKFAFKKMVLISVHQDLARISRKASGRTDGDQVLRRPRLGVGGECRHFRRLRDRGDKSRSIIAESTLMLPSPSQCVRLPKSIPSA
ncbi:hypothetical protein GW17_00023812 [Ensete ventricosum]|nr:hypothetical protein GW17_00023812 [Ensete ventricosum]RZR86494.1 hypothetical protein BHM03_00013696 [Ensete ventricosum]